MTLIDFIKENISLFDYYDKFIVNLDDKFKEYSYNSHKLVLCYFKDHEDTDPSMGWIYDKRNHNVKICHCFGCGRTANVVRLHQILSSQWLHKELTEKESCYELADMFNLPLDDFKDIDDDDLSAKFVTTIKTQHILQKRYTSQDFHYNIQKIKKQGVDLNKVNSECVKMIATSKMLYD